MLKLSHAALSFLSGLIWIAVGCYLLPLGVRLLLQSGSANLPLIEQLVPYLGNAEQAALLLLTVGLFLGYMKGRKVLAKAAEKGIARIQVLPNPSSLSKIYTFKYYILLVGMAGLGMAIKFFGVPDDIRGVIDVAIGAALIQGAMVYIQFAIRSWRGEVA